jgi:hypothetical protein
MARRTAHDYNERAAIESENSARYGRPKTRPTFGEYIRRDRPFR